MLVNHETRAAFWLMDLRSILRVISLSLFLLGIAAQKAVCQLPQPLSAKDKSCPAAGCQVVAEASGAETQRTLPGSEDYSVFLTHVFLNLPHYDPDFEKILSGKPTPETQEIKEKPERDRLGSPFVPLDSWVYPALKRLAALGYIQTQFTGLEPWTRAECQRQIAEADYSAQSLPPASDIEQTLRALKSEFSTDAQHSYSAQIDSVYARYGRIAGTPLRDSYHFGQTLWNDFGRPYDEGNNAIAGVTASAVAGRFFFYAQGEYEHAPGRGPLTDAQRTLIASVDANPVQPAAPVNTIDRFHPIDMYAGVKLGEYALTFGKQSLWLAPTEASPLMLSDNADPMYMLRLSRTTPLVLPGFLHWLGPVRGEFLFSSFPDICFPLAHSSTCRRSAFIPPRTLRSDSHALQSGRA